jgi:hypothetical protein
MTSIAERRAFLIAYQKTGTLDAAAAATNTPLESHQAWMSDRDYNAAYYAITRDLKHPPKVRAKKLPAPPKKRGRPRKIAPPVALAAEPPPRPETEPQPAPKPPREEPPSVVVEGKRGYTRIYVADGQEIAAEEPAPPPKPPAEPERVATSEVTVTSDADQRRIIDEYGELDRRMQLRAMETQRYESLKKAIKAWFDEAPADADGTVEGDAYLLHLSARERERRVRDMHELIEIIGIDRFIEIASVAIGVLENMLGKARVAQLTTDTRTGSRRIKAIPKRAAGNL